MNTHVCPYTSVTARTRLEYRKFPLTVWNCTSNISTIAPVSNICEVLHLRYVLYHFCHDLLRWEILPAFHFSITRPCDEMWSLLSRVRTWLTMRSSCGIYSSRMRQHPSVPDCREKRFYCHFLLSSHSQSGHSASNLSSTCYTAQKLYILYRKLTDTLIYSYSEFCHMNSTYRLHA